MRCIVRTTIYVTQKTDKVNPALALDACSRQGMLYLRQKPVLNQVKCHLAVHIARIDK